MESGLRLYSNRFCPFAKRVKLVLALYCIEHETININLSNKPDWISDLNSERKVPILEVYSLGEVDQIITESEQIIIYLDARFGKGKLIQEKAKYALLDENPQGNEVTKYSFLIHIL